jgi:hypothetical protein
MVRMLYIFITVALLAGCNNATPNEKDLFIGEIFGDIILDKNESKEVNVIIIERLNRKTIKGNVKDIYVNNQQVAIENFNISSGDTANGKYRIMNLVLELSTKQPGTYSFSDIILTFDDDTMIKEKLGSIDVISVDSNLSNNDEIEPVDGYTVVYPNLKFEISLKNNTKSEISIEDVYVENKGLEFGDSILTKNGQKVDVIKPNETVHLKTIVKKKQEAHFYVTNPIVSYKIKNTKKELYLPTVLYGHMNINDDIVSKIVK